MASSNGDSRLSTFSSLAKSCPIHFGPLKDAKSLPCGHAFCFECLKPYASKNRVVCPLCNAVHRSDIYLLPPVPVSSSLGSLVDALPASADEFLTKSKVAATENALRNVESACDMVIELLDSMKNDFRELKCSFEQKRQSLADELQQIDGLSNEEKSIESKNLVTVCDLFQRVCTMAQDRALHKILQVSKDVEDVCQNVKSIGLCRYFVDSEQELEADREKEIIDSLASLVQRYANTEDYKILCDHMLAAFSPKSDSGVWTAVVGDSRLTWNVPSTLLVQGQTASLKMIVYHSRQKQEASTHKLGMRVSQLKFKSIVETTLDEKNASGQESISSISAKVTQEFGGKWHCIGGSVDKFFVKSTGDRNFLLKTDVDGREYVCWKY